MSLELYAAYLVATVIVLLIPGPTITLVIAYGMSGRRAALAVVAGVGLGDLTAMTLSFLGLGAVLGTSATLFTVLKWAGAAYLVWLGIRLWRAAPILALPGAPTERSRARMLAHAYVVTALNPKSMVFFVAFVPQFIVPAAPLLPQLLLLGGTFLVLAVLNALAYALLAGELRRIVRRPAVLRAIHRTGGGLLIGAGVMTAALRRVD